MIRKHQSKILDFAQKLGSREAGFVFACLGVLSQTIHTWFITVQLSSLTGWLQFIQAGIMSLFLNGALLYFTLKGTEQKDPKQAKRYRNLVISFASLEVGINLYYWAYKFMIEPWPDINWGRMIIAIPFAIVLPIVLASYSFEVRVDDYSDNDDEHGNTQSEQDMQEYKEKLKLELTSSITRDVQSQLKEKYDKDIQELVQQYDGKLTKMSSELIPTNEQLLVKGLLSDQERVDLEFEWKDKQTGELHTRVLSNVKLKKIESSVEPSEDSIILAQPNEEDLAHFMATNTSKENWIDKDRKIYEKDDDGTLRQVVFNGSTDIKDHGAVGVEPAIRTDAPNIKSRRDDFAFGSKPEPTDNEQESIVEKLDKETDKLHKDAMSDEDKALLENM